MFTEFFDNEQWETLMPGVSSCIFCSDLDFSEIPAVLNPNTVEILYCMEGSLTLKRKDGSLGKVNAREILILSDTGEILSAEGAGPLRGVCMGIDLQKAGDCFAALCHCFGDLPLTIHRVGEMMKLSGGIRMISVTPWTRSLFYTLKSIPQAAWCQYCLIKTFELLYLICTQGSGLDQQSVGADGSSYMAGIAESMRSYMEEHLDEKLTILDLSRRFHLSRTACKSCFRSCFGQPIHSWILDRRMEQATELLEHTNMPVLQIAQSVGYSGVSQFNAAFKQRYGKTPREYRKMSVSAGV